LPPYLTPLKRTEDYTPSLSPQYPHTYPYSQQREAGHAHKREQEKRKKNNVCSRTIKEIANVKGEEASDPAAGIPYLHTVIPESKQHRRREEKNSKGESLEERRRKRKETKERTGKIKKIKGKEIGGKP
jgi:hypothetical protein